VTSTDKTFCVEHGITWVHGCLVFGSITDETFIGGESDIRRRCSIPLCNKLCSEGQKETRYKDRDEI
jgi:hypothetical protein